MKKCEFCGRSAYMNEGETCNGCGAPTVEATPAFMYDAKVLNHLDHDTYEWIARPGANIPVNLQVMTPRSALGDYLRWRKGGS